MIFFDEVTEIPSDAEWFATVFLPMTIDGAVENIFFVVRESSTIKDEIAIRAESYADFFNVKIFESIEDLYKEFEAK